MKIWSLAQYTVRMDGNKTRFYVLFSNFAKRKVYSLSSSDAEDELALDGLTY